jgi:hypothetical protein
MNDLGTFFCEVGSKFEYDISAKFMFKEILQFNFFVSTAVTGV